MTAGDYGKKIRGFVFDNIVSIIFIVFIALGLFVSKGQRLDSFINELLDRIFRNGFLVLSLIIPVMAGLGLNFGIVVGALAGMLSLAIVRYFAQLDSLAEVMVFSGLSGIMLSFLIALPLSMLFGFLTGRLYNKTRGQEMIASLIVGYFSTGVYQFIVLCVIGLVIPVVKGHPMIKPDGVGLRATFDMGSHPSDKIFNPETMKPGLKYSLDRILEVPFLPILIVAALCFLIFLVIRRIRSVKNPALPQTKKWVFILSCVICGVFILLGLHGVLIPNGIRFLVTADFLKGIGFHGIQIPASPLLGIKKIPIVTGLIIVALCLFTHYFTKTKLGQDCRTVGQSQQIAKVSGINVDRTRVIATMFSMVLSSWGMILLLQNTGTVGTYTSQLNVGIYSVAALLVGGASTSKASVKNALIGLVLFHSMCIVSPYVGMLFSSDAGVGEYTRSFMQYGVIGLALGLYIWKGNKATENKETLDQQSPAINESNKSSWQISE